MYLSLFNSRKSCISVFRSGIKFENGTYDSIIVQDLGQFSGVKMAVHHFGHLLGAYDDGDKSSSGCCSGDGYIMSKSKYNKANLENHRMSLPNSSYWSPCSVKAIEEFVSTATCLFNEPQVEAYPLFDWQHLTDDLTDKEQGGPPSLAHQCSQYMVPAVKCGDNPCQYLECVIEDHITVSDKPDKRKCTVIEKNYAMEGTTCGNGKFCFQGNCITGKTCAKLSLS